MSSANIIETRLPQRETGSLIPDAQPLAADSRPPMYDVERFPKLVELSRHWETIRDEFLALDAPVLELNRVGRSIREVWDDVAAHIEQGGQYGWLMGWGDNMQTMSTWVQYGLMAYDQPVPFAVPYMPRTIELLKRVGGVKLCALLRMEPNVFLGMHAHHGAWEEGLLHMQLTLDAPASRNYCYLNVNGRFNQSTNGNMVIFDGSQDHFAVNASVEFRTVMYVEFDKHQHLSAIS